MALTVTSAATETRLVELDTVLEHLDESADTAEGRIGLLVDAVSDAARQFCGRQFSRQGYQETVRADGGTLLRLSERPVVSVSSVTHEGATLTDFTVESPDAGLLYREGGWEWNVAARFGLGGPIPLPGQEHPKVTVDYVAGWLLPGEAGRTLPRDVEWTALEAVRALWQAGKGEGSAAGGGKAVRRHTIETETIEYAVPTPAMAAADVSVEDLPPATVSTLRRYRTVGATVR